MVLGNLEVPVIQQAQCHQFVLDFQLLQDHLLGQKDQIAQVYLSGQLGQRTQQDQ